MDITTSPEKQRLLALGYRKDPDLIALCVNRLRYGESIWKLSHGKEPMVSPELGTKIGRDYKKGLLEFLESFEVENIAKARLDAYRVTRYKVVQEAEEMAPHKLWNLRHMESINIGEDEARDLLVEYDRIRAIRDKAEIPVDDIRFESGDGKPAVIATSTTMTMARFPLFPRYLELLYEMHYRTNYPGDPMEWVRKAVALRVLGQREDDTHLMAAADDIMRYQVWKGPKNLDTYFNSLGRYKRGKVRLGAFRNKINEQFEKADTASLTSEEGA